MFPHYFDATNGNSSSPDFIQNSDMYGCSNVWVSRLESYTNLRCDRKLLWIAFVIVVAFGRDLDSLYCPLVGKYSIKKWKHLL